MFRKAISSPACRRRRREGRRCLARALVCRRPSGGLWVDSRISPKASDVSPNRGAFCRKDEQKRAVIGRFWVEDDGPPSDESDKATAPVISNYMFGRLDRLWRCFVSDGRNWRERSAFMPRRRDRFVDQLPGKLHLSQRRNIRRGVSRRQSEWARDTHVPSAWGIRR